MDKDEQAKKKARQERESAIQATASREDADSATARLDGRISDQRALDKEAKEKARGGSNSSPGAFQAPPAGLNDLSQMEADAAAKSRARSVTDESSRPGAYRVNGSSPRDELNQMESDIVEKSRDSDTGSRPGAYQVNESAPRDELNEMESDVTSKSRIRRGNVDSPSISDSQSGTPPIDLEQMEADVAAKTRARESQSRISGERLEPGALSELSQIEKDVAAKTRARAEGSGQSVPGIQEMRNIEDSVLQKEQALSNDGLHGELNQLEADVRTKQSERSVVSTSRPGATNVRDLEERIAYKTGIPMDDDSKDVNPAGDNTNLDNMSKLTGIPVETMTVALEKSRQDGGDAALLEHKIGGYQNGAQGDRGATDVETPQEEGDRLAVAVAVKEEEDDAYIPAAVQYDPDAKPPIYQNRKFRRYSCVVCSFLAIVVAIVVIVLVPKPDEPVVKTETPTSSPIDTRWNLGIQEQIELVVGSLKLNDEESVHYRALEWIVLDDPMKLMPQDPNLVQRFLLTVFYMKTHEDADWYSCNRQTEEEPDEVCSYQKLVGVFPEEYRGIDWFRWLSSKHECLWAGIFCDEFEQVRYIELTGQKIKSTLPTELAYLPYLQGISMAWNQFYGSLPTEYGEISQLLDFEIHYNYLTGTIPSWPKAKNLQLFNVGANDLTGTLPSDLKHLSNLKGLFVFENFLTGAVPQEFSQLSLLTFCRMNANYLTGTIITEIGNLSPTELWMHRMPLTGTLPSEIGNMRGIQDLRLSSTEVGGTIPDEIFNLTSLFRLDLYGGNFIGTLSDKVGQLSGIKILRVSDNELTGTLPPVLGNLTDIQRLWVEGNEFTGEVPSAMCNLRATGGLYQLRADCLNVTGEVELACECCEVCCHSASGTCERYE